MKSKNMIYALMVVPVLGWLYIVYGTLFPFENSVLKILWHIDIALSAGLHSLQLIISIPEGRKAGLSMTRTVIKTLIFGATWWKPLKHEIISK